jgi:hypothetical protein
LSNTTVASVSAASKLEIDLSMGMKFLNEVVCMEQMYFYTKHLYSIFGMPANSLKGEKKILERFFGTDH